MLACGPGGFRLCDDTVNRGVVTGQRSLHLMVTRKKRKEKEWWAGVPVFSPRTFPSASSLASFHQVPPLKLLPRCFLG